MNAAITRISKQAGVSLTGLIISLMVIGMVAVVVIRVVPTFTEYQTATRAIASAKAAGNSDREIRAAFDRQAEVGYISSLAGKDLEVVNKNGTFEVSFAYQKVIPLVGNASLLMDYQASTATSGKSKSRVD